MIPVVFRTPRSLAALNVAGVALAIAVVTSSAFMVLWTTDPNTVWPVIVGFPTLAVGVMWATLLRRREKIGHIAIGWFLSIPLAALNAGIACALMLASQSPHAGSLLGGMFLGATFGVIIWAPALAIVLMLFGLPLAHARRLAESGLASEEQGERFVGGACIALTLAAVLFSRLAPKPEPLVGTLVFYSFAVLACVFGAAAALVARKREAARRRFVARVEAEEVPGLRVEPRTIGKVIVRAEPHVETYRIAPEPDEELFELDEAGRALRASARID